ncbi:hypothetical protein DFH08DRAFT_938131 [Mycena albidolilacea]|uniref:Uncharacterized protein n=1 Tax=Mycena albidolilacea TaxID=1033008 RepID=A0AAD6ZWU8_9AGAR|nr:hypothetical protein DFH08DRAFT_938131 [Mycena albidolilacea]
MVDSEEQRGAVGLKKFVNHLDAEVSTVERLGRPEYSSKRDGNGKLEDSKVRRNGNVIVAGRNKGSCAVACAESAVLRLGDDMVTDRVEVDPHERAVIVLQGLLERGKRKKFQIDDKLLTSVAAGNPLAFRVLQFHGAKIQYNDSSRGIPRFQTSSSGRVLSSRRTTQIGFLLLQPRSQGSHFLVALPSYPLISCSRSASVMNYRGSTTSGSCPRSPSPADDSLDKILLGNAEENQNSGYADFQLGSNTEFDWFSASISTALVILQPPLPSTTWKTVVFAGPGGIGFRHMIKRVVSTEPELPIGPPLPVSSPYSHLLRLKS